MGVKDIKYVGLFNNYKKVMETTDELFTTLESVNSELQQLSGCWEGSLASAFSEVTTKMSEYSYNVILNLKNTEEYKNYVIHSFQKVENVNMEHYNIM